jgi:hypothetical protein
MKQHYPGPEACPRQSVCGATAEVMPSRGDYVRYRCPKCGEFRISQTVDENFKGPGHFRTDDKGIRWLMG